jgi:hypothetical protein
MPKSRSLPLLSVNSQQLGRRGAHPAAKGDSGRDALPSPESEDGFSVAAERSPRSQHSFGMDADPSLLGQDDSGMDVPPLPDLAMDVELSPKSQHSFGIGALPSPQSQYSFGINSSPLLEAQDGFGVDVPPSPGSSASPQSRHSFGIDSLPLPECFGNPLPEQEDPRIDFPPPIEAEEATSNRSAARCESHVH